MVLVEHAMAEECAGAAAKRRRASEAHRPKHVRDLLIAQTPPLELDRYFYFRCVPQADYLFRAVVPHFLGEEPARLDKQNQLSALQALGVYLIDLKPDPCDSGNPSDFVESIVRRVRPRRPDHVVLIKVDVYDAAFHRLRDAGLPVIDKRIPFPSSGRQTEFCRGFKAALKTAGWASRARCGDPPVHCNNSAG